ncbi:hypothetical protein D3C75_712200 [compost metagenome]
MLRYEAEAVTGDRFGIADGYRRHQQDGIHAGQSKQGEQNVENGIGQRGNAVIAHGSTSWIRTARFLC